MRKSYLAIYFIVLSALVFAGCRKDERFDTQPQPQPSGGQLLFSEEFTSDTRGWAFDDQLDSAYAFVQQGYYKFVDYSFAGGYHTAVVPTGIPINRSFRIQTRMQSNNAIALVFGASANDYGYSLFIDDQGYYALYKEGYPPQALIDWQQTSAIRAGWNDIEVEQVNGYWYGYANGTRIFETPARQLSGTECGFMVLAGTTGQADYLRAIW